MVHRRKSKAINRLLNIYIMETHLSLLFQYMTG